MDWFLYDNGLRHERVKFHVAFLTHPVLCLLLKIVKDNDRESTSSNKTQMLPKSMNMDIWLVSILNQLFIRGPYKQIKFLKK